MFDNIFDVDAANEGEVAFARMLDVGIIGGTQEYPRQTNPMDVANRLLIFTGTAVFGIGSDSNLNHQIVRVRVRFQFKPSIIYVGSATVVALASIHGNDD